MLWVGSIVICDEQESCLAALLLFFFIHSFICIYLQFLRRGYRYENYNSLVCIIYLFVVHRGY